MLHLSPSAQGVGGVRIGKEEGAADGRAQRIEERAVLERHIERLDCVLRDVGASLPAAPHTVQLA